MSNNFTEKCNVAKWFWWRAIVITVLFLGLAGYFFYDWKVGYPKKNYKLVQYNSFMKAKEYFLKHVEDGRSPEQWVNFVKEQDLLDHQLKDVVQKSRSSEYYPTILQDYAGYKSAYDESQRGQDTPVLWDAFSEDQKRAVLDIKATFSTPPTKEDKRKLKGQPQWDAPLPVEYVKGNEEGNYRLLLFNTFKQAEDEFRKHVAAGKTAEEWAFLTSRKDLAFDTESNIIPAAHQGEKWPAILEDYEEYYKQAEKEITDGISVNKPYLWKEFTAEKKWGDTPPKSMMGSDKIREQLFFGIGVAGFSLLAALFALRMKGRFMAVDDEVFYAPGNKKIPFSSITKIDKRKWENKGLATIYYNDEGASKKVRLDGMVYGQFDKAQGEPAEKLFQVILANFKGELVELVSEEEESSEEKPSA